MKKIFLIATVILLSACGGDLAEGNLCPINCSNSSIGFSGPLRVTPLGSATRNYQCLSGDALTDAAPIVVQFQVYRDGEDVQPSVSTPSDRENAEVFRDRTLLRNIAFTPYLEGIRDASKTNPTIVDICEGCGTNATSVTVEPFEFHGITTRKQEWCSDACGVARYAFVPKCSGADISTDIRAGIIIGSSAGNPVGEGEANTVDITVNQVGGGTP